MAQVKPTEGLSPHEVAVLITIMTLVSDPSDGVMPHKIQELVKRSGYTPMASTLGIAGLKQKDMIECVDLEDPRDRDVYTVCKVTHKGLEWLLENQDRFQMTIPEAPKLEKYGEIKDEDIPL
jgi:hypothetical protein